MAVTRAVEVEQKYAVPDGAALPPLVGAPGVLRVEEQPLARLDAVYLDTADRVLLAARIALRRRTGGHDAGWHVKLPAREGRTELHAPIDAAAPDALPADLERALRSRLRGRPLVPLAEIRTERRGVLVHGPDGAAVEVVDDAVHALDVRAGTARSWREWEAEQVGGAPADDVLLAAVHHALLVAGAVPSPSPAKLAQALGGGVAEPGGRPRTAGALLGALLAEPAEALHRGLLALVLDGDPDGAGVHELRRTLRRLRSLLALRAVAGPAGAAARAALGPLGRALGAARDPRVAADAAAGLLDRLPEDTPGLAAARRALVDAPRGAADAATAEAVRVLLEPAALDAYAALDALVAGGADGPDAGRRPGRVRRAVQRSVHRAARRARSRGGDLDRLHRARKAAKRDRFAVEALVAAGRLPSSDPLVRAGRRAEAAQDALGEHRDLALLLAELPAAAEAMTAAGEDAYALGAASELLRRDVRRALHRARRALRRLRR